MSGRKRRIDVVDNSDNDNGKKQARVSNLGSGANSGQSSSALNAEAVAKAPKTTATVASKTVSGEALGTKTAPAEAEQSRDKGKQRLEQVEEPKEAAGGISVNNKESTAGPSTEPSKQPSVKRPRRKKNDPVPDPVQTALTRIKNNPNKRTDRACNNCRRQKLKCDNNPDGCAQCVKRNIQCTLTLATQQTYVRGGSQENERDRDGLNLEVERLRADVDFLQQFVQQEITSLRQDFNLLREENIQLRRALEGYRRAYLNYIQLPQVPSPPQAPPNPQYTTFSQGAEQGAAHFQLPTDSPPRQGSPSVQPDSTSPYRRTDPEASADNDDSNSGATNNAPAFVNQVASPMTEQGGGQSALTAMSLDVSSGFSPQPANVDDFIAFTGFDNFNGDNGGNGVDPTLDVLMLSADRDLLLAHNNEPFDPNAAYTAGPATDPFAIDPTQLTWPPVDYPQVSGPATTLALRELQNERDHDGPQQN